MSSFTKDRFLQVSLPNEFFCHECGNILEKPVVCTQCGARKCENCESQSQENCAHSFAKHDNLAKRLQELLIKCRHYQHGCQKILRVSQIYQHEREDCEYSKLKCDSKQCEELSKDGEIKHLSTCGFFVMKCEFCFKEMRLKEKPKHNCIEWLTSIVEGLEFRNNLLSDEQENLRKENEKSRVSQENERKQIENALSELENKREELLNEKERLQRELELEVKTFDEQIQQKLKGFKADSSAHLSDFSKRAKLDLEKHSNLVGDLMKYYLKNVTENLEGLNINIDKENKTLEKVTPEEIKLMREKSPLRVFVGTPQKKDREFKGGNSNSAKKNGSATGKKK